MNRFTALAASLFFSSAQLPPACDPALQPYELHATSGAFGVGSFAARRALAGPACAGDDCAVDDDGTAPPADDGKGFDDDASNLIQSPSPAPGSSASPTPSLSPARATALSAPLTCVWVVDGGGVQKVELEWEWVRAGATCGEASGALVVALDGSPRDGGSSSLLSSPCSFVEAPGSRRIVVSNSTALTVVLSVPARATDAYGFRARFRLVDADKDCTMSPWSAFGACSVACGAGGVMTQTREVTAPATGRGTCTAPTTFSIPCILQPSCAPAPRDTNCALSPWSQWGSCEAPHGCGDGTRSRTRNITGSASGRGTPCPPPSALRENVTCTIPCLTPACNAASRPLKVGGVRPTDVDIFGVGAPPRLRLPATAAAALSALPARFPGNTNCSWVVTAPSAGTVVNLSLAWVDVPSSAGCGGAAQGRVVVRILGGVPVAPPFCGSSVFLTGSSTLVSSWLSPPGGGFLVEFISADATTSRSTGFGAVARFPPAPPPPLVPPPPSDAHTAAVVSLVGAAHGAWANLADVPLLAGVHRDVASSLGAPPFRFAPISVSRGGTSVSVLFLVTPPLRTATAPAASALVGELVAQLGNARSALRLASTTRGLAAGTNGVITVVWALPPTALLEPTNGVTLGAPGSPGGAPSSVAAKLVNAGGSPLGVSAATLLWPGGAPPATGAPFNLVVGAALPTSLPAASGSTRPALILTLTVDDRAAAALAAGPNPPSSVFAILSVTHADADGPHSLPVTLYLARPSASAPPSPLPVEPAAVNADDRFSSGLGVGALLAFALLGVAACGIICCRRAPGGAGARPSLCSRVFSVLYGQGGADRSRKTKATPARPATTAAGAEDDESESRGLTSTSAAADTSGVDASQGIELTFNPRAAGAARVQRAEAPVPTPSVTTIPVTPLPQPLPLPAPVSSPVPARGGLVARPQLKASDFEGRWKALPTIEVWGAQFAREPRAGEVERALAPRHISCMASGSVSGVLKFYFFAQGADATSLAIAELSLTLASRRASCLVKATPKDLGAQFLDAIRAGLNDDFLLREEDAEV